MWKSLVNGATTMELTAIAEYVEGEDILNKLRTIGVPYGQGFHLRPPGPLEALFPGDTPRNSA